MGRKSENRPVGIKHGCASRKRTTVVVQQGHVFGKAGKGPLAAVVTAIEVVAPVEYGKRVGKMRGRPDVIGIEEGDEVEVAVAFDDLQPAIACAAGACVGLPHHVDGYTGDGWKTGEFGLGGQRRSVVDDEDAQGLAEYALILALIAIVAIVALIFLGGQISDKLSVIGNEL